MTQFQLAGFLPLRLVVLASNAPVQPGDRLCLLPGPEAGTARLTAPGSRDAVLTVADADANPASAAPAAKQPPSLLAAVLDQVKKRHVTCIAQVTAADASAVTVLLAVQVGRDTWASHRRWPAGDKPALLFVHLVPPALPADSPAHAQQQQRPASYVEQLAQALEEQGIKRPASDADAFSLASCFSSLPMKLGQLAAAPMRPTDSSRPCHLNWLDARVTNEVLSWLDLRSLVNLAATCRHFKDRCLEAAPGLQLALFPHQREAVLWMQQRERASGPMPHPTIRTFQCLELAPDDDPFVAAPNGLACTGDAVRLADLELGLPLWADTATGELWTEEPSDLPDSPGGLFCDEPGLGKTITTLALVLRTLHRLPALPAGAAMTWVQPGQRGFYTLSPQCEPPAAQQLGRRRSSRGGLKRARSGGSELEAAGQEEDDPDALCQAIRRERRSPSQSPDKQLAGAAEQRQQQHGASTASAAHQDVVAREGSLQQTWVQCDSCHKWRQLPVGHEAPSGDWVCAMNPDEDLQRQGCGAPEDMWDGASRVLFCPGWVAAGSPGGAEHNVTFYRQLLAALPEQLHRNSPLSWLSRQPLAKVMQAPFSLLRDSFKDYPTTVHLFQKMELQPRQQQERHQQPQPQQPPPPPQRQRQQSGSHGSRGSRSSSRKAAIRRRPWSGSDASSENSESSESSSQSWMDEEDEEDELAEAGVTAAAAATPARRPRQRAGGTGIPTTWQRPASHAALELDQRAIQLALREGPLEGARRIYRSPATLVVVPQPEHIEHWRYQIRQHVRAEAGLRVLVYTAASQKESRRLGSPLTVERLAWEADVVLTTFQTLTNEWGSTKRQREASTLMQVHFLRVLLDEGHSIGGSDMTSKHMMATQLRAERRWIMTGTPAPNAPDASVDNLRPLLAFLHQQPYSEEGAWKKAVQEPFHARQEVGRLRLLALLQRCMIRASKAELISLGIPPLVCKTSLLDFAPAHATSYNYFVDIVRFNLLTADWYDPGNRESMLNARNSQYASSTLNNLRLSCNVAGNCQLQVLDSDVAETMQLLTHRHISLHRAGEAGPSQQPLAHRAEQQEQLAPLGDLLAEAGAEWGTRARHIRACLEEGGACELCGDVVRVMCVTPCACLLCVKCASLERTRCPQCDAPYTMQSVDDPARRRDNPNPKWDVPLELIEWQPAYAQRGAKGVTEGTWQAEWKHTQSTKCVHLLLRLLEAGAAVRHGSGKLPTAKAIVYTQFWQHMSVVERYLRERGVGLEVFKRGDKDKRQRQIALSRFQHSPSVGVLLMDSTGQVGLDLSFVSHVFLMEPVMKDGEFDQVVSRAHRMGARHTVHVETLAMRGTVEEEMLARLPAAAGGDAAAGARGASQTGGPRGAGGGGGGAAAAPPLQSVAKSKAEADKERRNELFLSLRPVPARNLPEFEDVPGVVPLADLARTRQEPGEREREPGRQPAPQQQGAGFPELPGSGSGGGSEQGSEADVLGVGRAVPPGGAASEPTALTRQPTRSGGRPSEEAAQARRHANVAGGTAASAKRPRTVRFADNQEDGSSQQLGAAAPAGAVKQEPEQASAGPLAAACPSSRAGRAGSQASEDELCNALLDACQQAQHAGLTEDLVGLFLGDYADMPDAERQRHSVLLRSMLARGAVHGVARYLQTSLRKHDLLPTPQGDACDGGSVN